MGAGFLAGSKLKEICLSAPFKFLYAYYTTMPPNASFPIPGSRNSAVPDILRPPRFPAYRNPHASVHARRSTKEHELSSPAANAECSPTGEAKDRYQSELSFSESSDTNTSAPSFIPTVHSWWHLYRDQPHGAARAFNTRRRAR